MKERFTLDGSGALEERLAQICRHVRSGICAIVPPDKLEAIYLGGGYGRGEGGVLRAEGGDAPYNDLEFWVFLRGHHFLNENKYGRALHILGGQLSHENGIEVEFKIASLEKLKQPPPTMFAYDLAMGHRRIYGHGGLLSEAALHDAAQIPLFEATRLLMNRCSGLLYSQMRLEREPFTAEDADFVGRNQAKAQLGFGDVLLAACGQYHWSCRERNERLKALNEKPASLSLHPGKLPFSLSKLVCHHSLGVDFKLHPQRKKGAQEMFQPLQTELLALGQQFWLWLENRRLNREFASVREYALSEVNKCPETTSLRNRLVNLKTFGAKGLTGHGANRYPRERLLHSLPLLLWEPNLLSNSFLLEQIQSDLRTEAVDFPGLAAAYEELWRKFN